MAMLGMILTASDSQSDSDGNQNNLQIESNFIREKPKYIEETFLTISIAVSFAIIFYAVTYTAASYASTGPYATTLALGFAVILILSGLVDVSRAEKGLLT